MPDFIAGLQVDWTKVNKKKLALALNQAAKEIAVGTDTPWDDAALEVIERTIESGSPTIFGADGAPQSEGKITDFINSPAGQLVLALLKRWLFA